MAERVGGEVGREPKNYLLQNENLLKHEAAG